MIVYALACTLIALGAAFVSLWLLLGLPFALLGCALRLARVPARPVPRDAIRETERY